MTAIISNASISTVHGPSHVKRMAAMSRATCASTRNDWHRIDMGGLGSDWWFEIPGRRHCRHDSCPRDDDCHAQHCRFCSHWRSRAQPLGVSAHAPFAHQCAFGAHLRCPRKSIIPGCRVWTDSRREFPHVVQLVLVHGGPNLRIAITAEQPEVTRGIGPGAAGG